MQLRLLLITETFNKNKIKKKTLWKLPDTVWPNSIWNMIYDEYKNMDFADLSFLS